MSLRQVGVLPLPHSHGAAVHSPWSLHGPLQTERVKVNYVGDSLSSPLLPLGPLTACGPGSTASQSALCLSLVNKGHAAHRENMLAKATHPSSKYLLIKIRKLETSHSFGLAFLVNMFLLFFLLFSLFFCRE